ncbi:MAG: hydroxyisourate hydrolase [Terrimicrobiaceae bacterium]
MSGKLTTHVIDTSKGQPASGIRIELHRIESSTLTLVSRATTGLQGRTDQPLMEGDTMISGFLEIVPVRFRIADPYSTYRGC